MRPVSATGSKAAQEGHSPGHIAATDEEATEEYWEYYRTYLLEARYEHGFPPITRESYEHELAYGSLYVGSPATVAANVARTMKNLHASRFDLTYGMGPMPHSRLLEPIRMYGTDVVPRVKELLAHEE
ncbi:hypothetical protein ACFU6I_40410 [Streptomyces sp. NPDC057486]|uniref:hypothetical protein n=1 Tax=Streptomyces sp. NPDC057486 TaxID=3346145 RepID=UPI0036AA9563